MSGNHQAAPVTRPPQTASMASGAGWLKKLPLPLKTAARSCRRDAEARSRSAAPAWPEEQGVAFGRALEFRGCATSFTATITTPRVWLETYWCGVRVQKCPLDLWVYQEILAETRPGLIVETGRQRRLGALHRQCVRRIRLLARRNDRHRRRGAAAASAVNVPARLVERPAAPREGAIDGGRRQPGHGRIRL